MKLRVIGAVILSSLFVMTVPAAAMADDTMGSTDTMQAPTEGGANATAPNANNVGATPPATAPMAPTTPNNPSDDMSADTATGDDDY